MKMLHLLNKELRENRKNLSIYALAIFLILFIPEMINAFVAKATGEGHATGYLNSFPAFLFLGGFILTSMSFSQDMFSKNGQHNWLMLPASSIEKFLAKALLTAFAYPLALIVLFTISSIVIETTARVFMGDPFSMFNPFTSDIGRMLLHYLVTQSVFLLGATYFKKTHFVKTVLSLAVLATVVGMLFSLIARIAFAPYFDGLFVPKNMYVSMTILPESGAYTTFKTILSILYWALLAPFCWFTSYQRVKEVQATDAIQ